MKIKDMERAVKLYQQIKELDNGIIAIDKLALTVAGGNSQVGFSMKVVDIAKKDEAENKVKIDGDGDLVRGTATAYNSMFMIDLSRLQSSFLGGTKQVDDPYTQNFNQDISDTAALQILGILLGEKHLKRQELLVELEALGCRIK